MFPLESVGSVIFVVVGQGYHGRGVVAVHTVAIQRHDIVGERRGPGRVKDIHPIAGVLGNCVVVEVAGTLVYVDATASGCCIGVDQVALQGGRCL